MGPEGGDNPKPGEDPPPKGPPAGFADRLKDIMKEIASLVKFNITISWGVKQSQAKIEAEFRARMIDYQNKLDEWKASWEEYNEKALEYNEAARIYSLRYHAWLLSQPTPWYKPSPKDDSIPIIPVPP
jgi:hypothetical protein